MNFNMYRYFNEVAETRSIRRAADRLHVAPSAISRQIALLEHQLGTLLLERSNTGIQLTSAGLLLERYTRTMFRDLERVQDSIRTLKGLRQGEVKLWVMEGLLFGFLPRAINKFNDTYPAIRFTVFTESTDRILEAMIRDEADIGIVFNAKSRPGIETVADHTEPVMCLVAAGHTFADRDVLSLSEICTQQIALPVASFGLRQLFDKAVSRRNLSANAIVSANSLELTRAMAITGRAITIGPALAAAKEIGEGALKAIPIEEEEFAAATSAICVHRDRRLSYAANEFLKMLIKEFPNAGRAAC